MPDMSLGMDFLGPIAQAQKMGEEAAAAPGELAHTAATTRYLNAQAGTQEYALEGEKKAAALMASRLGGSPTSGGKTPDPSDFMLGMAQIYSQAGLPAKAEDAMNKVGTLQSHEATARAAQAREEASKIQTGIRLADKFNTLLDGVHDQASWDAANAVVAKVAGRDSPWAAMPYDPAFVKSLKDTAMTAKQKADV